MLLKSVLASFLASAMLDNERHLFSTIPHTYPPSSPVLPLCADVLNENWYREAQMKEQGAA